MRWLLPESDSAAISQLAAELKLQLPAARVLWQRGYRDPAEARRFLAPTLDDLHDPYLLRDMDRAVARLSHHLSGIVQARINPDVDYLHRAVMAYRAELRARRDRESSFGP